MPLDLRKTRDNYERAAEKSGGFDRWKPQANENPIRLLPHTLKYFTEDVQDIAFMVLMHYGVGPANRTVVCPRTANKNNRCPVCERAATLKKSSDPKDQDDAKNMYPRKRYFFNIIDLASEKTIAKGIQAYEGGPSVHTQFLRYCNEKWGDILSPDTGRNLVLDQRLPADGNKARAEYLVEPDPNISSIRESLPADWKEQIKKLETILPKPVKFDDILRIMEGEVDAGVEGEGSHAEHGDDAPEPAGDPAAGAAHAAPAGARQERPAEKHSDKASDKDAGGQPACFGVMFSTKNEKCVACSFHDPCKATYLK